MQRIRPPYRPDDDIPFKSRGWRITALLVVLLLGLVLLVGVIGWLRWVMRGLDAFLIYMILLFFAMIAPLAYAVWHYFDQERN